MSRLHGMPFFATSWFAAAAASALFVTATLHAQERRGDPQARDWVRVAVDYDRDGRWDGIEHVQYEDLQRARQQSRQRAERGGRVARQMARTSLRARQEPRTRVEGVIEQLRRVDLVGGDEKDVVVGRVQTNGGPPTTVCFGPTNQVAEQNLQPGDRVAVEGVRARLNEEPLVIASRVSRGEDSIRVRLPKRGNLRQFSGRVTDLRTTTFRGREGEFVVARLRTGDGRERTVNLGRRQELQNLDLDEGDRVRLLARPGRINDRPALIAQLVRANEATADVRGSTNRTLRSIRGQRR